jgi:CRP-like cAMP-binding protein
MMQFNDPKADVLTLPRVAQGRRNLVLAELPTADLAILAPHLKDVPLNARDVLHEAQDDIEYVYFPHSGMVSLLAITDDGETIETAAVGQESAVGAFAGLGIRRAFVRAVVQVPGSAARIAASTLQKAAQDNPRIRDMIARTQEGLLVQAQQSAVCGALHGVEARLARWLLQTQDRARSNTIPLIQEFLAQVLGVRRTTVNLVVRILNRAGLVRYRRGQIEIINREGLEAACCPCYRIIQRQLEQLTPPEKAERLANDL